MNETNIGVTDLLDELYNVVQDAKGAMLQPDKCVLDRNEVLNIIDDIIAVLPEEVKNAKKIVDSRNELVSQGRREAEHAITTARSEADSIMSRAKREADALVADANQRATTILTQATEKANDMISRERVVIEAENRSKEMIAQANAKIEELKKVSNMYMAKSLAEAEQAMEKSLNDLKVTKRKFENLTGTQSNNNGVSASNKSAFFQEIGD